MSRSGSQEITIQSRICIALIFLGGGRVVEAMRTHGVVESTTYSIYKDVLQAINNCPQSSQILLWKQKEVLH